MTVLIIVTAVLVAALLGWPLTALVLKLARKVDPAPVDVETTAGEADAETAPSKPKPDSSASTKVLRGGLTIGILERIAVVLCIAFDQPVAIAYKLLQSKGWVGIRSSKTRRTRVSDSLLARWLH
ncbi:hypothetical protein [Renibacterium salmoninarum]|uniref:hypothetical protein n=1 Tax=Renibacterium salmoninarum TaxID=1646 RepID=UPI002D79A227|nr:hypothetical protein [Renibacterium salmoninarum]